MAPDWYISTTQKPQTETVVSSSF